MEHRKITETNQKLDEETGVNSDRSPMGVSDADLHAHPVIKEPWDIVTNKTLVRARSLLSLQQAYAYYGRCECQNVVHKLWCRFGYKTVLFQCENNTYVWAKDEDLIPIDAKVCDLNTAEEVCERWSQHLHAEELRRFSDGFTGNMVEAASIQFDAKSIIRGWGNYTGSKCIVRKDRRLKHYSPTDLVPEDSKMEADDNYLLRLLPLP